MLKSEAARLIFFSNGKSCGETVAHYLNMAKFRSGRLFSLLLLSFRERWVSSSGEKNDQVPCQDKTISCVSSSYLRDFGLFLLLLPALERAHAAHVTASAHRLHAVGGLGRTGLWRTGRGRPIVRRALRLVTPSGRGR